MLVCHHAPRCSATDLAIVPLFNSGQTELLNTWGGSWSTGVAQEGITLRTLELPDGNRALNLELRNVAAEQPRYLQCFASGFGPTPEYRQTRNILAYSALRFQIQNQANAPLRVVLQIKDHRDTLEHRALYSMSVPNEANWNSVEVPLNLKAGGWKTVGEPDLDRVLSIDFVFLPEKALEKGEVRLKDLVLVERDGPLDVEASPLHLLVERLAMRQWRALWSARSRQHGLIPNNSYQVTDAGLNTTAALLWMLPAAVRHGWIDQRSADSYVVHLSDTIHRLLDRSKYLPPRNVDWLTLKPSLLPEESSVDAAFLALALYQYEHLPTTSPSLQAAISQLRGRFDFASFAKSNGWSMAYRYRSSLSTEGFVRCVYDGYTNEGNLLSLAAHLSPQRAIPIERHWNSSTNRIRACAAGKSFAPVVHRLGEFRSPFTQALWSLFVDVRQRGVDSYPDDGLAVNPWQNFVCYQQSVLTSLAEQGRAHLLQPDAGDDGTLTCYRQFSVYDNFGRTDLFMPWSAAIAVLAGVDGSEDALRFLLANRLQDAFGLVDSARWKTAAPKPYFVASRHDFWNTGLSTMAMLEWLDGDARLSRSFASIPEVRRALDRVFPAARTTRARVSPAVIGSLASP